MVEFLPKYHMNRADACVIVRFKLDDEEIPIPMKVRAIEMMARMETHNGILKDEMVKALRWLFDHYDFE